MKGFLIFVTILVCIDYICMYISHLNKSFLSPCNCDSEYVRSSSNHAWGPQIKWLTIFFIEPTRFYYLFKKNAVYSWYLLPLFLSLLYKQNTLYLNIFLILWVPQWEFSWIIWENTMPLGFYMLFCMCHGSIWIKIVNGT